MVVTISAATQQIDYADLDARWERGNWSATEIGFTQDRDHWRHAFTPAQRRGELIYEEGARSDEARLTRLFA